ncbi:unnamed protein product [Tuwongella immobilis]|uniref:Uncharacterized protein n=1 Tax=Tuwongella immobilis TaxID=692036 RepID=A0A6C2YVL7_9BACT|nr:unnamed protein product [Tuwongella immobilis]VTS07782.1 unnamed protein product [Tuwongella immobilis]
MLSNLKHDERKGASIRPQIFVCGNMPSFLANASRERSLQFGHRFLSVEMRSVANGSCGDDPASIRPQIFVCGNEILTKTGVSRWLELQFGHRFLSVEMEAETGFTLLRRRASIRPQIFVCGNDIQFSVFGEWLTVLQFGHRFLSVEIPDPVRSYGPQNGLQFGHRFLSVEMGFAFRTSSAMADVASIRPQIFVCGNVTKQPRPSATSMSLQFGHRFLSVEILRRGECVVPECPRFNSATDFCLWKCATGYIALDKNSEVASIRPQIFVCGN